MKPVPHGEPYAGKLHVRFDEGAGVPDNKGRPALLYTLASPSAARSDAVSRCVPLAPLAQGHTRASLEEALEERIGLHAAAAGDVSDRNVRRQELEDFFQTDVLDLLQDRLAGCGQESLFGETAREGDLGEDV